MVWGLVGRRLPPEAWRLSWESRDKDWPRSETLEARPWEGPASLAVQGWWQEGERGSVALSSAPAGPQGPYPADTSGPSHQSLSRPHSHGG